MRSHDVSEYPQLGKLRSGRTLRHYPDAKYRPHVGETSGSKRGRGADETAQRKADVALITRYHEAHLRELLESVRAGFRRYEAGEVNAFELDGLIHHYKRSARELWKFCGDLSGSNARSTARALRRMSEEAERVDWWERGRSPSAR